MQDDSETVSIYFLNMFVFLFTNCNIPLFTDSPLHFLIFGVAFLFWSYVIVDPEKSPLQDYHFLVPEADQLM